MLFKVCFEISRLYLTASCPTSPPGGNLVDGLPPASHTRASCDVPRLGRGQIYGKRVFKLQFLSA